MSYQFELALRQYIATFDGTNNISPTEFKSRFDNLYHKDFIFHAKDRNTLTREDVYERESRQLASGTKVTLIHFRKIGLECFDIKVGLANGKEHSTIRAVTTISAKQATISREIDESILADFFFLSPTLQVIEADCKSTVSKWKEFGTYVTNL